MLSSEDTQLLQALCGAMRNVDFKKIQTNYLTAPTAVHIPADPNISQAGSDRERSQQAEGRINIGSNISDSNVDDSQLDTGGVSLDKAILETRKPESDTDKDSGSRSDNGKRPEPVACQTTGRPNVDTDVTRMPSVAVDGAEDDKNKPEEDIPHKLYKVFKDVNDKLQLLENAMSRLGGVGDVLSGIRKLRASFVIALRWDKYVFVDESFNRWKNTGTMSGKVKCFGRIQGLARSRGGR